jgi:hypothetical protein
MTLHDAWEPDLAARLGGKARENNHARASAPNWSEYRPCTVSERFDQFAAFEKS